jgi:hypothetical protein
MDRSFAYVQERVNIILASTNERVHNAVMDIKEFASLGGKARAKNMTKKQRQEAARKAVNARWSKRKRK